MNLLMGDAKIMKNKSQKRFFGKRAFNVALSVALGATTGLVLSCGSASNNDQGVAFQANGWYVAPVASAPLTFAVFSPATDTPGLVSGTIDTNNDGIGDAMSITGSGALDGKLYTLYMGITNRLTSQFMRMRRIDCRYEVPGADDGLKIPTDSYVLGGIVTASPSTTAGASSSSSAGGQQGGGTGGAGGQQQVPGTGFFGVQILSPDIVSFFNNNKNSLPPLPYQIIASCTAVGTSSAGNTYESNPLDLTIQAVDVSEYNERVGVNGGVSSPGSGGTPGVSNGGGSGAGAGSSSSSSGSSSSSSGATN